MGMNFGFIIYPAQNIIRRFFNSFGYEIVKMGGDHSAAEAEIMAKVKPFTAAGPERMAGLINAVNYLSRNKIEGDFVECGVWRGGSMMAAMLALLQRGDTSRHFFLFDTYEGMPPPSDKDTNYKGERAEALLALSEKEEGYWCVANLDDVQKNIYSTGYPKDKIHFIKGRVEDTLPALAPKKIALLRLDTDWYESTAHELAHLYPLLCPMGVLIIDDYGFWQGSRKAVDEYFTRQTVAPLLSKMDFTGRLLVKPS